MILYTGQQMEEFIRKMSEYGPVKDEFTKVLQVEVEEQDLDNIMAAAAKEKENIGQIVHIYKEKTVKKGRGKNETETTETVFG